MVWYSEGDQRRVALSNVQGLVSRVGFPAPRSGLDVLHLTECGLCDLFALIKLRRVLKSEGAELESRMAEVRLLEKRVCMADGDLGAFRVARVLVDELTSERASLTTRTEQVNAEGDTLAT